MTASAQLLHAMGRAQGSNGIQQHWYHKVVTTSHPKGVQGGSQLEALFILETTRPLKGLKLRHSWMCAGPRALYRTSMIDTRQPARH